jgi:hypothetical protein
MVFRFRPEEQHMRNIVYGVGTSLDGYIARQGRVAGFLAPEALELLDGAFLQDY